MTPTALASGRYRLERRLGHGGMATVYLADDVKLERRVAVKLLAENVAGDDEARRRFEREARLAAKLDHPNVVQIFDVGEDDGDDARPFIVMEYVEGGTLAELVGDRDKRPAQGRAVELLSQACDGLAHAHRNGLIHRDVKPQNLLIRRGDGKLKVADFGIARAVEETALTRTGFVLGTRPYMAPEQLGGGEISPATDVYALGVVGRELLGERPEPQLDSLLRRCLSEDPAQRFSDAAELREALRDPEAAARAEREETTAVVDDAGRGAEPTLPTARLERTSGPPTSKRRRVPVGAALLATGAIALAVVAIIAGSGDGGSDGEAPGAIPDEPAVEAEPAPRLDDPVRQGRAFADWLRQRSR